MAPLLVFAGAFAAVFYLLRTVLFCNLLVTIGVGMVAWTLADVLSKAILNALPKKTISPEEKAVVITGCDTGFGHELAKRLDQYGFTVFAGCLFPDKEGANNLRKECSDRLQILQLDVTNDEQVKAAAKEVSASLNGKDLWAVVNNAGIATFTEIEWCPMDTYRKIFDVNALGPIRVTKAFLPMLRESHGRVVIVASLAGRYTFPGFSAYSMSKYAAVSFADGLRREMKKWGITVHTVEPTLYKTPISSEDNVKSILKTNWDSTPADIQETYGQEYFNAFQDTITSHIRRAKDNLNEVIDDLVDAVAGQTPKMRYVPSVVTQIRARFLSSIPTELQDYILCCSQPKCPPAFAKLHPYVANLRPELRRTQSEPAKFKSLANNLIRRGETKCLLGDILEQLFHAHWRSSARSRHQ